MKKEQIERLMELKFMMYDSMKYGIVISLGDYSEFVYLEMLHRIQQKVKND